MLLNSFSNTALANEGIIMNDLINMQREENKRNNSPETNNNEIIYKESSTTYYTIDPKKDNFKKSYYPGLRGPNQLIVYTKQYGDRTGTNEFGTEAIVENNIVIELNGADSIIPEKGFVISGHGKAKKWITENIQLGSKVYIDTETKTIRTYLTPESLLFAAKQKIKDVNNLIEYYNKIDVLYNDKKAQEYLEKSKEEMRKAEKNVDKTQYYITESLKSLDIATQNAIPYIKNELKGVWVRPIETNKNDIERTVEKIKSAGLTDIFLETYFHGKTIYPSAYLENKGIISQREEFIGFDPLQIWIEEAHKRGLKIHTWFETFYVGNDNPSTTEKHVLNVYPEWSNKRLMNYNSELPVASLSEHNGYFLDPSNEEVREHLKNILKEIINNYNIDGINLDYIRYPQTVESSFSNYATMNWGYTKTAREEFSKIYKVDPIDIKYPSAEWELWALYRQNKITSFVEETSFLTKEKGITLTAVIFPDIKKCIDVKLQNWRRWSFYNYVDGLTPLILTGDKNTAELLLKDIMKNTSPKTNIYAGIFVTFMGGEPEDLLMQIQKGREYKAKGSIFFDYAHLEKKYVDALTTRIFNENYDDRNYKIKSENTNYKPKVNLNKREKKKRFRRKSS